MILGTWSGHSKTAHRLHVAERSWRQYSWLAMIEPNKKNNEPLSLLWLNQVLRRLMGRHLLSGACLSSNIFMQPSILLRIAVNCPVTHSSLHRRHLLSPVKRSLFAVRSSFAGSRQPSYNTMSAQSKAVPEGQSLPSIEGLTLHSTNENSKFPGCYPSLNPVDIYREHIAETLGKVADIDPQVIYPKLAWTSTLDKGDLTLAVSLWTAIPSTSESFSNQRALNRSPRSKSKERNQTSCAPS